MRNVLITIAAAAMMIGGGVGCSPGTTAAKLKPGTLPPGTAQLTVNGNHGVTTGAVQCSTIRSLTIITSGNDTSGATVMVSNAEKPVVEFVRVRNLNDFTGDYNLGLAGNATVNMRGPTYHITGTARGYSSTSTEPTTEPFAIMVSC